MVRDLSIPVEVVGVATTREVSGLAMSSRNGYLSDQQKTTAANLFKTLAECATQLRAGQSDFSALCQQAKQTLKNAGLIADYFEIAQRDTLKSATVDDEQLVILAAAYLGNVRLIDNLQVDINNQG